MTQQHLAGVAPPRFEVDLEAGMHTPWPTPPVPQPGDISDDEQAARWAESRESRRLPFGMGAPMRRAPDVLPIGALMLVVAFVLGFLAGAGGALWWVAR